ncbi:MAG: hypothetical protein WCC57_05570, partial [Paracoccaceae bacterium]
MAKKVLRPADQPSPNGGPNQTRSEIYSQKALIGKKGFIFLGGSDANSVLDHLAGKIQMSPAAINVHRRNFAALDGVTCPTSVLVVPEAHLVYSDLLPSDYRISLARPVSVLRAHHPGRVIYPLDAFKAARKSGTVIYTGRDSHWTEFAAIEAYKICRTAQGITQPFTPAYTPDLTIEAGDLTMADVREVLRKEGLVDQRSQRHVGTLLYANGVRNNGSITIRHNPTAPLGRCLAFGTSFSRHLITAYSTDFKELIFCYGTTIDPEFVAMVQPDHLFIEQPERFIHMPQLSVPGGVLCSHALRADPATSTLNPTQASPALGELVALLVHLANLPAPPDPAPPILPTFGRFDLGPQTVARLNVIAGFALTDTNRDTLRILISGLYRRAGFQSAAVRLVDSGILNPHLDLLPDTEMGLLARIRAGFRLGKRTELLADLVQLV